MGKGAGCASSTPTLKDESLPKPAVTIDKPIDTAVTAAETAASDAVASVEKTTNGDCKIFVVYYSMYGHTETLARAVAEGIGAVDGCKVELLQVAEILSKDVLDKMGAPPRSDVPEVDPSKLPDADAIVFGFPTSGVATGKRFVQGGGQEVTLMTAATQLAHHGMIYVPAGYSMGGAQFDVSAVKGGSPWGAGCFAGADGSRQPSAAEVAFAQHQGKHFARLAKKLAA